MDEQRPDDLAERRRRRVPRTVLAVLGLLVVAGAAYGIDLYTSRGDVPRGTTVAGTAVGGASPASAETTLRAALEPRTSAPLELTAGDVRTTLDPAGAGLGIDWPATLAEAGAQPLNPWTRITSFFSSRDLSIVTSADRKALDAAVGGLRGKIDRKAVEGAVRFDGATPVAVAPVGGQALRTAAAADTLADQWFTGKSIELKVDTTAVAVSQKSVDDALGLASRAVSGPLVVTGQGDARATLSPEQIAGALTFAAEGDSLRPSFDVAAATETLRPQLAATEKKGSDAQVRLGANGPEVVASVDGQAIDWGKTLTGDPLTLVTAEQRAVKAVYATTPAEFTTAQANALGLKEVIGEFTTGGFADASGVNIRLAAQEIQGALVRPGTVFSLNGYTGERGTAEGYVESGIIIDGRPGTGVGGGISQLATTLYNAGYFAGLEDVEHREHSYYISRYPEAREATVYEGSIDVKFRAPAKTGVLIQTIGTDSNITVRIWGTKTVDVESITGGRSAFTSPRTVTVPAGEKCAPSSGAQGFTVSNTRVIRALGSGQEISRSTQTVTYDPVPIVRCG